MTSPSAVPTTSAADGPTSSTAVRIDAAKGGCHESFGVLAEHCRQYLLLVASGELPHDLRAKIAPSDVVQETLVRAQQGIHRFSGNSEAEFRSWIRQILVHYAAHVGRHYRQTARRRGPRGEFGRAGRWRGPIEQLVADFTPPAAHLERLDQATLLERRLERAPAPYRRVLMLRTVEGLPFADVGEVLGVSAEAARKLWVRAIAALQREIKRDQLS